MNALIPEWREPGGPVRARRNPKSDHSALLLHTFCPSITYSSPSRRARVRSEARSLPASGSLNSWHQVCRPLRMSGRCARFCSSVPKVKSAKAARCVWSVNGGSPARASSSARNSSLYGSLGLRRPPHCRRPVLAQEAGLVELCAPAAQHAVLFLVIGAPKAGALGQARRPGGDQVTHTLTVGALAGALLAGAHEPASRPSADGGAGSSTSSGPEAPARRLTGQRHLGVDLNGAARAEVAAEHQVAIAAHDDGVVNDRRLDVTFGAPCPPFPVRRVARQPVVAAAAPVRPLVVDRQVLAEHLRSGARDGRLVLREPAGSVSHREHDRALGSGR